MSVNIDMWFRRADIFTSQLNLPFHCVFFDVNGYSIQNFAAYGIELPVGLRHAVVKRQAEYLAGRLCAQVALKNYGLESFQVVNGDDRAPIWPEHITASISHTKGIAAAMAVQDPKIKGVGIDIECLMEKRQESELQHYIINPDEMAIFANLAAIHTYPLTIIFSAKESLYKALYPSVKRFFGFDAASLISFDDKKLVFILNNDLTTAIRQGQVIDVYYQQRHDLVLTECVFTAA
ncbi:enterobactin synthetase component D [Pseudoalteromonas ulvae UL12]|uniref:4'-phosphopantetheinyl transferase family protein n=1 Tax=Pseudoalteromonas ulvae TaxID=107327 RepID=UPI001A034C76|nr:4'-phosphopantetheinyl transferase superfamily protein [Pseudoalteromonas ulvae]MBE0361870.1 enterobactin synthetase component D [Pseudoalteromonas ulvae UL12]